MPESRHKLFLLWLFLLLFNFLFQENIPVFPPRAPIHVLFHHQQVVSLLTILLIKC